MGLNLVPTGSDVPHKINVVVEIPLNAAAIKYEVDKDSGAIFVDRMLKTAMYYPCNYGYIPHTLCGDGDPADVLVIMPLPVVPGCVVPCRPIGVLKMEDEAGEDDKLVAVPTEEVTGLYRDVQSIRDIDQLIRDQISHFFEHYKDLERGKWVKIGGWRGDDEARTIIEESVQRFNDSPEKPHF